MLKLIIADDEELVLETLTRLINWEELGISLIGTCKNGIEAYNMILDDSPDIVLTDLKMPGLTGLELIEKISAMEIEAEFVILSGYGEFEYAKQAMKYGIRHYLLKPCNEIQIIEVMETVKKYCYQRKAADEDRNLLTAGLEKNMIKNLFLESLSQRVNFNAIIKEYEPFADFYTRDYELCYFYYLPETAMQSIMAAIPGYMHREEISVTYYMLCVTNTLVLIFGSFDSAYTGLDAAFSQLAQKYAGEYRRESYQNLALLLPPLIARLVRYETIYFTTEDQTVPINNHTALTLNISTLADRLISTPVAGHNSLLAELCLGLAGIQDLELLKALFSSMILKLYSLLELSANSIDLIRFSEQVGRCHTIQCLHDLIAKKIDDLFLLSLEEQKSHKDFIEKLIQYVHEHLSDPTLSLKKAAGTYLYMNADYLGKQFLKQTGFKFSAYLNHTRMEKAKQLLAENGSEKIYIIAEQVGCGDNPQYFSQLFKKHTKMTPTAYAKIFYKSE